MHALLRFGQVPPERALVRVAQELEPRSLSKETHLTPAPRSDSKCQALIGASAAAATEAGAAATCLVLTFGHLLALALVASVVENPTRGLLERFGKPR